MSREQLQQQVRERYVTSHQGETAMCKEREREGETAMCKERERQVSSNISLGCMYTRAAAAAGEREMLQQQVRERWSSSR